MFLFDTQLFPFDGRRRLRRDVVAHAIDAFHLINNIIRHLGHKLVWQMHPVGGHAVGGDHRPESDGILIAAFVAHHADRLHR